MLLRARNVARRYSPLWSSFGHVVPAECLYMCAAQDARKGLARFWRPLQRDLYLQSRFSRRQNIFEIGGGFGGSCLDTVMCSSVRSMGRWLVGPCLAFAPRSSFRIRALAFLRHVKSLIITALTRYISKETESFSRHVTQIYAPEHEMGPYCHA